MTDFWNGIGHGFLGLAGFGSVYDPLGDLRSDLASKTQEFNNISADYAYKGILKNLDLINALDNVMNGNGAVAKKQLQLTSDLIWESLETENLFIIFLYVLVFIVIFYLIVKK